MGPVKRSRYLTLYRSGDHGNHVNLNQHGRLGELADIENVYTGSGAWP